MRYLGDITPGLTVHLFFSTQTAAGVPIVLAGSPAISVYIANTVTPSTAGITLDVNFNSVVGLNHVAINTSNAFYVSGNDFNIVISAGTVNAVSVVGRVVGAFSIGNRSALTTSTFNADYVAPSNANIATIMAKTNNLPSDPASESGIIAALPVAPDNADIVIAKNAALAALSTSSFNAAYVAPNNSGITAIEAKTNNLPSDPASESGIIAALPVAPDNADIVIAKNAALAALSTSSFNAAYIAPSNANIATIMAKTNNLPSDPASESGIIAALPVAPDNADIALIKAKTDQLHFTIPNEVDSNVLSGGSGNALSTSHFDATYIAPDNADIVAINAKTNNLPSDPASESGIIAALPVAPDNADIALIKAKTDQLHFTIPNEVDSNVLSGDALSTSHFDATYVAPDNADIAAIKAKTDTIPSNPATNTEVDTRLAEADYVAPDNAGIASIEASISQIVEPSAHYYDDVVTDKNNVPIAGAIVYLTLTNDHTSTPLSTDETDAGGNFRLYAPSAGTYYVTVNDTGFVRSITQVVIT